jgi:membrane peptidoglycan carboxypeptidase
VTLSFALDQSCNRPWTDIAMRLGARLNGIVRRFDIVPPESPSLVPIGGIATSPLKLAQSYGALNNEGRLPSARFLAAAIGARGEVLAEPQKRLEREVMSRRTASLVREELRGPVKRGTARAANSTHALVYGKTGTSSRNEDALFVGLTEDFTGAIWLGHDRPAPMPGVHGGGAPAKVFARLTDFYYLRRAQARFSEHRAVVGDEPGWRRLSRLGPEQRLAAMLAVLASLLMLSVLLLALFSREKQAVPAVRATLPNASGPPHTSP